MEEITAEAVMTKNSEESEIKAVFIAEEARVFACLMEKQLTTPKNYPLTINSLMLACNQKSNREPVMSLSEGDVGHTVQKLAEKEFTSIEYGERANKVFHKAGLAFGLNRAQQAVMCMLMLRAPMTLSDIKSRTERMVSFDAVEDVKAVVDELMQREQPLVVLLPKGPGRREDRYSHLLCGAVTEDVPIREARSLPDNDYQQQIDVLQQRIEKLERHMGITEELV
jgi:uncharacterized protein YceH (UPF0502 family)